MLLPLLALSTQDIDPRGPILSYQNPPIVKGRQSVQVGEKPTPIHPADRSPGIGQWIWLAESKKGVPARFLYSVDLSEKPKEVRAWITAEARYRMWINGRLAARGPADSGRDYDSGPCGPWLLDVRSLTQYFKKGTNIVAVEVFPEPLVQFDASTGQPGLRADFQIRKADRTIFNFGTSPKWLSQGAHDLDQNGAKNGFRINFNHEPIGWQRFERPNEGWTNSVLIERKLPETLVSELPPPLEAEIRPNGVTRVTDGIKPNPITGGAFIEKDGGYALQFGHVLAGYVGMKVKGHNGACLIIRPNEHDAPGANRQAEIILRDGEQTFELPYFDSFSVINVEAHDVREPIEIEDVRCVFTSYPVQYRGSFECSNPECNRLWEVSRWVTQICMQTLHLDSPHHQEPISDAGDYLIESLNAFYAFGDGTLARQDLKKIARTLRQRHYQSFHTSYSLLWLHMLIQYYDYTGDAETVKELAPDAFKLMDQFESYLGPNGLVSQAPNYMFMDWVEIEGFNLHHPPAVIGQGYMTALYYQALGDAKRVAQITSDTSRNNHAEALRQSISKAFGRELWNEKEGLYRDGKPNQTTIKPNQWLPSDKDIETFSTQVNTLAVSCGLVEPIRATTVMKKVLARKDMNCQPYFMHFVFEAMNVAGLFGAEAEKQINRWQVVPDTQSFHEMWTVGDLSHAWNATPMFQMSGRILGIQPTKPGFKEFRVKPDLGNLKWAKGTVPTPFGSIQAKVKRTNAGLQVEIEVPKGTTAVIASEKFSSGHHSIVIKN